MAKRRQPKRLPDGRAMLNLACGWKMHWGWNNVDFSPYALLARHPQVARWLVHFHLLSPLRQQRLARVDPQIIRWDLREGIPFDDGTFDAVYHSHFLEHVDRDATPDLLTECRRVLKVGGVIRVVVPDWRYLAREYQRAVEAIKQGEPGAGDRHRRAMEGMLEQMVRRETSGAARSWKGGIERLLRGNAARTGELHRWMYDEFSLAELLTRVGFRRPGVEDALTSRIQGWAEFKLDVDDNGLAYKTESLYLEAEK